MKKYRIYLQSLLILCFFSFGIRGVNTVYSSPDNQLNLTDILNPQKGDLHPNQMSYAIVNADGVVYLLDSNDNIMNNFSIDIPDVGDPSGYGAYNVTDVAYSPTGDKLAISISSGSDAGILWIADLSQPDPTVNLQRRSTAYSIRSISWKPDGSSLALSANRGVDSTRMGGILLIDAISLAQEQLTLRTSGMDPVCWHPSIDRLAYAIGNNVIIWDTITNQELNRISVTSTVSALDWSPSGNKLATLDSEGKVQVYDSNSLIPLMNFTIPTSLPISTHIEWQDENILVAGLEFEVLVFNTSTETVVNNYTISQQYLTDVIVLPENRIGILNGISVNSIDSNQATGSNSGSKQRRSNH